MVMRIAIPVWEERISPVFDTAGILIVVDLEDRHEISRQRVELRGVPLPKRVERVKEIGPEILLCGAISRPLFDLLASSGIEVVPFLSGEIEEVLAAFLENRLSDSRFVMPGCCGQRRRRRFGCRDRGRRGKDRS